MFRMLTVTAYGYLREEWRLSFHDGGRVTGVHGQHGVFAQSLWICRRQR
jgi:hypothetical protein